jgi:hypothetical protein
VTAPLTLDPASVEAVARRVVELLRDERATGELLTAAEVAERFNCSRDFVYRNADRLGAIPLGDGPRARLRFDPAKVADALAPRPHPATNPHPKRTGPRRHGGDVELLPVGRKAA